MKRRLYLAAVLFVALWPALQFGLATSFRLDRWNLFGWAMYAAPDRTIEIAVGRVEQGRTVPIALSPETTELARRFALERSTWGRLARPDALAKAIAEEVPVGEGLAVQVRWLRIDPLSGEIEAVDEMFGYR